MEQNNLGDHDDSDIEGVIDQPSLPAAAIGWGIAAVVLSILAVTFNNSYMVLAAGFFGKFFAVIAGSILGLIGALIGDALCRFARPTMVFTQGGLFSLVFLKLFWLAGPQVIGLFIGVMLGMSQVLSRL